MDLRTGGKRVDRLEADPEAPDGGEILGALRNATDPADIRFGKGCPEVRHAEHRWGQIEGNRPLRVRSGASCERIFGVLQKLVDEVRTVVVTIRQQHRPNAADVRPVPALVLRPNCGVVGCHDQSMVMMTPSA